MPDFVAIGSFDGVHRGHRRIIATAVREACSRGMRSRVLYFPFPPKFFFSGETENCLITLPQEREELLAALGPDRVQSLAFGRRLSRMSAPDFFSGVIMGSIGAGGLCAGHDFAVGRGREGHSDFLDGACRRAGIVFRSVPFARRGGHKISSSLIRAHLRAGSVEEANLCLGWEYFVRGKVAKGAGVGRKLGFPTANIAAHPAKILPPGVFAAEVRVSGRNYGAVVNVGHRPTVAAPGARAVLEAHLLDFSRDIYGRAAEVTFLKHIRPERRFASRGSLARRIAMDIAAARRYLSRR